MAHDFHVNSGFGMWQLQTPKGVLPGACLWSKGCSFGSHQGHPSRRYLRGITQQPYAAARTNTDTVPCPASARPVRNAVHQLTSNIFVWAPGEWLGVLSIPPSGNGASSAHLGRAWLHGKGGRGPRRVRSSVFNRERRLRSGPSDRLNPGLRPRRKRSSCRRALLMGPAASEH